MRCIRQIVKSGALTVVLAFSGGALAAESLTQALVSAYSNSNLMMQNRALLRATDENVAQAVAAMRPVVSFIAQSTHSDPTPTSRSLSTTLSLNVEMLLYDFGRSPFRIEAAKEGVLATRKALISLEQQVLLQAVTAYMNMRRDLQVVALNESNERLITQELRASRDRFEVGEITRTDVSLAEARLAAARSALAAARGQLEITRAFYLAATGHFPGQLQSPPMAPGLPRSLEAAQAIARDLHPDIHADQHNVKAAELNLASANAARKPVLSMGGGLSHNLDRGDSSSIGLTLRVPIYQGGQLSSIERQAFANLEATRFGLQLRAVNVNQGVANSWANLTIASAQIQASDQQIRAAEIAFRGVREEAALGARTTLDVLNAEQELLDARSGRVTAQTNGAVASYALLAAMGKLTVEHLNLPVERYDPTVNYNAVSRAPAVSSRGQKLDQVTRALGKN